MKEKRLTELALLTGLALIIFIIELQIPNSFPIPEIKLGLPISSLKIEKTKGVSIKKDLRL